MYPPTARSWVLACNVIDGKLIWSDAYPDDVKMDMARLVKKALAGDIIDEDAATFAHHLGRVVKGLKPGSCPPNPQQLAELQPKRRQAVQRTSLRPSTTRQEPAKMPKRHPGLTITPIQDRPYERLRSGIEFYKRGGFYVTQYAGKRIRLQ